MNNQFRSVKAALINRLYGAGLPLVLNYPDDISKIGNLFPIAVIMPIRAEIVSTANMYMQYMYYMTVYVITQCGVTQSDEHDDIVIACLDSIYTDNSMNSTAINVNPMGIEFGATIPYVMDATPMNAIQCSAIQLEIKLGDIR